MSGWGLARQNAEKETIPPRILTRWVVGIALLAVAVRVCLLIVLPTRDLDDQEEGQIARSLLSGGGFSLAGQPTAHKPVLYPLILAASYAPFPDEWRTIDYDPSIHQRGRLVDQLLKIFVAGLTVPLIFLLGRRLFSVKVGILACLLFALNPQAAVQTLFPGHMVYDMLAFTGLLLVFLELNEKPTAKNGILFGAAGGICLLLNPAVLPFWLGASGWFLYRAIARERLFAKPLCLSLLISILLLLPWVYRNDRVFQRLIPFTSNMPLELWFGNNPLASGEFYRGPSPQSVYPELESMSEPERNAVLGAEALRFMVQHPGRTLQLRALSWYYFWFGVWRFGDFPQIFSISWLGFNALTVLLAWVGLGLALLRRKWEVLVVLMLMVGVSLPYILTHGGDDRYRAGLIPVLMILIAYCLTELFAAFKHSTKRIAVKLSNV